MLLEDVTAADIFAWTGAKERVAPVSCLLGEGGAYPPVDSPETWVSVRHVLGRSTVSLTESMAC